ncbi:174_t:CDS:2, partial [Funneliformis caledonium]
MLLPMNSFKHNHYYDNDLTVEYSNIPITPVLSKDISMMEIDPIEESSSNNLEKEK